MIKYLIFSIAITINLYSCNDQKKVEHPTPSYQTYFNLTAYLDTLLSTQDTIRSVSKTIRLNDFSETKEIDNYNIKSDLLVFSKKSIAHPKFIGKYEVGTKTENNNNIKTYIAIDPKLTVKKLTVERNQQQDVLSIEILEQKETAIIKQDMRYYIEPSLGYGMMACDSLAIMGKKCKGYEVKYR